MEILYPKRTRRTIRTYGAEQRRKVIETFVRFGCSAADAMAKLGHPNRKMSRTWWKGHRLGDDEFPERRRAGRSILARGSRAQSTTT